MEKKRVYALDEIRGVLLIGIMLYHLGYDFAALANYPMQWFWSDTISNIRYGMAGSLMVISGISCSLSRSNRKRGVRILAIAMLLTLGTLVAMPSQLILFGVLHYFGCSILLFSLLRPLLEKINPLWGAAVSFVLFAVSFSVPSGYLQFFGAKIFLPPALYQSGWLFWLGFPSAGFMSADYYPLLPWSFLLFGGAFLGMYLKTNGFPAWSKVPRSRVLDFMGRNTMVLYLVHQPLFIVILTMMGIL